SLAYQVAAARADLRALPDSSGTSRPVRRLEEVDATLRRTRPEDLDVVDDDGVRRELLALLEGLHEALRGIADAVATQHFWHPSPMQSVGVVTLEGARQ
ncbi:MAG TPA: alpha-E domain-containing protein, partial [Nakamurella sp.]